MQHLNTFSIVLHVCTSHMILLMINLLFLTDQMTHIKGPWIKMRQKMMSHDMKVNRATVKVALQSKLGFYLCLCLNV